MFLSFIISMLIIMVVDYVITIAFAMIGLPLYLATIVSTLLIAFIFSYISYRRRPGGIFRNPRFHRDFAIRFVVFMIINIIFVYL